MSNRPDLELALDVRSDETVVVISSPDNPTAYPSNWTRPTRGDLSAVNPLSVVVVDRVDILRKTLSSVGAAGPRLVAMAPQDVPQEKTMRRLISSAYPWAEVWTISTSFGKLLVTKDARGPAYEREDVIDMRPPLKEA